ncbi:hypothetical protein EV202_101236 [Bacteroides heparinolyticus]|uniref:Lipoprotein n=1 Tax=Prevotella heparinolytica TaxID=28113 RepID=A0A4R2LW08_9BACE|nr:hypothetical protein [Bacteroides heparinolyticus]MCI6212844.1 hypothetical protein [Bacteroides heparinolyticus]TCO96464.1 hypothetical protein EV202_101236 [Bacteroides heparinolyticus]
MKQKTFYLIFCACIITGCMDSTLITENNPVQNESKACTAGSRTFQFPVLQWENFENYDQKIAACQIPEAILPNIPTDELIEICMEYPLLFDAYAFNTPLAGLKIVVSRFNGFQELMSREDNCLCTFNFLKEQNFKETDFSKLTKAEEGKITLNYALCEYLISFDEILHNATDAIRKDIARYAYQTLEFKESQKQNFAWNDLTASVYLCAKMSSINKWQTRSTNPALNDFLATGVLQDMKQFNDIKQQCRILIQD